MFAIGVLLLMFIDIKKKNEALFLGHFSVIGLSDVSVCRMLSNIVKSWAYVALFME